MTPHILAIDVSGPGGGAALLTTAGMRTARIPPEMPRARDLLPALERLLREAGLGPAGLDAIACGVGPGSFTGLRIGVAAAAAFAWAGALPAIGVGSLHGIAENAPGEASPVMVALDARRGNVFCALFRRDGPALRLEGEYRNVPPAEAAAGLPPESFVIGDGYTRYPAVFARFRGTAEAPPRPDVVARLAAERFAAGERPNPAELRPLYLRPPEPELVRREREQR